jgi:hypothetical protein
MGKADLLFEAFCSDESFTLKHNSLDEHKQSATFHIPF